MGGGRQKGPPFHSLCASPTLDGVTLLQCLRPECSKVLVQSSAEAAERMNRFIASNGLPLVEGGSTNHGKRVG